MQAIKNSQMDGGLNAELFQGETKLHLGKKHTFNDIAKTILDVCTKTDANIVIMAMRRQMKEKRFLDQEKNLEDLMQKIKEEKEARK